MKIIIETIPHDQQRYPTCGDWQWTDPDTLSIKVSQLSDWRRGACVAIHELAEVLMCKQDGVTEQAVDEFDKNFEANRAEGNEDEPGDDPAAPYRKQHFTATNIERILAQALGVDWKEYEDEICALP